MLVYVRVEAGPHAGRRIDLRSGQTAVFGATDLADFCFERDSELAATQFQLTVGPHGCQFHQVDSAHVSRINGTELKRATLKDGDLIEAGQSRFRILLDQQNFVEPVGDSASAAAASETPQAVEDMVPLCQYLELSDAASDLAPQCNSPSDFIQQLEAAGALNDAIRVQANELANPLAVKWAVDLVGKWTDGDLPPAQREGLEAASRWASDPTEEHRRTAEAQAEKLGYSGLGATLAAAAFYSGGSIAAPDLGHDVELDPRCAGTAVTVALIQAASMQGEEQVTDRLAEALAQAVRLDQ